jgi:formylglycine-generating enzyme required for sulfatase activity
MATNIWARELLPARAKLTGPLIAVYRDSKRSETQRRLATSILRIYAADNPELLADLLMDGDGQQFISLFAQLNNDDDAPRAVPVLIGEIEKSAPSNAGDDAKEKLAKRQANAAVALLRMKQEAKVWPLLRRDSEPDDPRLRSYVIHRFAPLRADAAAITKRLEEEPDISVRRALILSLGEYGEQELSPETRQQLVSRLQKMYVERDPGVRAASEWLLRTWSQGAWLKQTDDELVRDKAARETRLEAIQQLVARDGEKAPPQWYVNGQGQTMVVIPGPVEFQMGSPPKEEGRYKNNETLHKKRIARTFALATKSVTIEQYQHFDERYRLDNPAFERRRDLPAGCIDWYRAAQYCNWLSEKEEIPKDQWCYEIKGDKEKPEVKLKANYLRLRGYRLPTEAEMEYAIRARAVTARYYGETEELLPKYAWYVKNSQEITWPVGTLKPNDLGFFDMQGNVFTWCQERYKPYPPAGGTSDDVEDDLEVDRTLYRVMRGGSFASRSTLARSADRNYEYPTYARSQAIGFRVARTLLIIGAHGD